MPKRNLVWMLVVVALGVGLWVYPHTILRRDTLYRDFSPLLDVRAQIQNNYVDEVTDKTLLRGAIRGMLRELDRFSDYFDEDEYTQFRKRSAGHFFGIGVEVSVIGGYLTVISPIEGTPAHAAGLRAGDRIIEIDGQPTQDLSLTRAVALISGEVNTQVRLRIWSVGDAEPREIQITRGLVTLRSVKGYRQGADEAWDYFADPDAGIGYVRLTSFDENTPQQLDQAVQRLYAAGLRGLILDLRDNPGGLLKTAVAVADRFLGDGRIVSTSGRKSDEEIWTATPAADYPEQIPVVILVNGRSASASEILAGALRDHGRAVLVGEKTFGKGSVQNLIELDGGESAMKITTAYYYLPKGERIHGHGVDPDHVVDLTPEEERALFVGAEAPTSVPATTAPASQPAVADRQLEAAMDVMREQLGLPPLATTRAATTQPAAPTTAALP
ncbi:MAG: PDZ domain-containing protein [Phycisphaerae bacterium]|nr:PDZ domain-containing protein [Phycisphaerae bacterium]